MNPPTTSAPPRLMTADEFYEWGKRPENLNGFHELERGEVIDLPSPEKSHGVVCYNLCLVLGTYLRQRGYGYITANDSGVILERGPDTVRGPDVAVYEDANSFAELHPKYGEVPPCLAIEVQSPSDRQGKVMAKIMDYLHNGVPVVWVLDFEEQTVTVYRPDRAPEFYTSDQELAAEDVLPGFRCKISEFFFVPGPKPPAPPAS